MAGPLHHKPPPPPAPGVCARACAHTHRACARMRAFRVGCVRQLASGDLRDGGSLACAFFRAVPSHRDAAQRSFAIYIYMYIYERDHLIFRAVADIRVAGLFEAPASFAALLFMISVKTYGAVCGTQKIKWIRFERADIRAGRRAARLHGARAAAAAGRAGMRRPPLQTPIPGSTRLISESYPSHCGGQGRDAAAASAFTFKDLVAGGDGGDGGAEDGGGGGGGRADP